MKSGMSRIALGAAAVAVAAAGTLTACSSTDTKDTKPAEAPASSAPAVSPSEKVNIGSFTPTVTANPAPTALPGNVVTGGG